MLVRTARRTSLVTLAAAALVVGTMSTSYADSKDVPQIVDATTYSEEGGVDPQSMLPQDEATPATGSEVQAFADLLMNTSGLELFQAPAKESYEGVGQTLRFSLGDKDYAHPLVVTRVTVTGDVPESVIASEGDETHRTTLPNGTQVMTAKGSDGTTVATLSKTGQLTAWEAPAADGATPFAVEKLTEWATTVDAQQPGRITAASAKALRAKPKCWLYLTKPYTHGGAKHIAADASMNCDQKGKGNFTASLRQYHGLGLWKSKSIKGYTNEQGKNFPVTLGWTCSKLTVSNWVYRADIGNATLRNGNGYWGAHNVHSATKVIHCA
ncbi:hypothetical protein [Streptomyces sp. NPDC127108]|uniref:hypothetical protein n=1 Tax=Streptomyces sp. NPDC127108 TaxID=3345361 RepID=UPI0036308D15